MGQVEPFLFRSILVKIIMNPVIKVWVRLVSDLSHFRFRLFKVPGHSGFAPTGSKIHDAMGYPVGKVDFEEAPDLS